MASTFIAQCQGCDFKQNVIGRTNYAYRLLNPPDVFLWTRFEWCSSCQRVVRAEKILTAAMEEWIVGSNSRARQDMERYRQMMTARVSSARCLECGSSDIITAAPDRQGYLVLHPECGANVVLHHNGFARLTSTDVYSPEGEHLTVVDGVLIPGRGY